ncbi:MAG: hypothetical protein QOC81_3920 [Thermoanaerobaculia bacterium]|jgi:hypothetical protein|nr:hypothetical protein [Thermoanaerobaculia bacterium]
MKRLSLCILVLFWTASVLAQDVRMNALDNAAPNKNNATTQSETNHAVTANGVVGAWNDSGQIPTLGTLANLVGWRGSPDGVTFSGGGFFQVGTRCYGDPAVVADGSGFFYLAGLGNNFSGIGVARSTGTLAPFSFGAATFLSAPAGGSTDKELMAVDRTGGAFNDRIYLTATNLGHAIVEAHSTALNPPTFTAWQTISPAGSPSGSMPAVAPDGDVYVVWLRGSDYEVVRSSNGGGAYTNPDVADPAAAKVIATSTPSPSSFATAGTSIRAIGFPQMAIDATAAGSPTRGNLYVVYHAHSNVAGSTDNADIFFTRSTNNGVTWSAPRSISSGAAATIGQDPTTNDNWNPSIAVSPVNGHIYVTFYDRREDTTAGDGDPAGTKTRLYRALSTDAGQTWNVAPFSTSLFVPIAGFVAGGAADFYWSEYNWSTANANGLQFTWGDSRSLCAPPMAAPNPCSPAGRPDQDSYYRTAANLSGPDLFIKPWGVVTGEGPSWQTPYIFVVDGIGVQINAQKGVVNHLRARIRNLGNAAASGAVIRFKFSPAYAGFNESVMKEIGTVPATFSAAGGGTDDQVLPIEWDLTDTTDTNSGVWPMPVSAYNHFCVLVRVELPADVNLSNNFAQNNFFDVMGTSPGSGPFGFMVAGPDRRQDERPFVVARLTVSKLPEGFRAVVKVDGVENPEKGFRLKSGELRNAKATFVAPRAYKSRRDVVANVTLQFDQKPAGGFSARLYRAPGTRPATDVIGKTTAPFWETRPVDRTVQVRGEVIPPPPDPPKRIIPKPVKFRRTFRGSYGKIYEAILSVLRTRELGPEFADQDRGLINTKSVVASRATITKLVDERDRRLVTGNGSYWMSLWLEPHGDTTEVGIDALIHTEDAYSPLGRRFQSNGTLEQSILAEIARVLGQ